MHIPHNPAQMTASDLIKAAEILRDLIAYANREGIEDQSIAAELRSLAPVGSKS